MISRPRSNVSHLGSIIRSRGQIKGQACDPSVGHICHQNFMIFCQHVHLDDF